MAGTTTKSRRTTVPGQDVNDMLVQFNKLVDDVEVLRGAITGTNLISTPALAIGSTPTAVANGAFTFRINGVGYAKAAVAAGTAPGNDVVPEDKYGAVAFEIGVNGTVDAIEATDNATGYDSAALAVAGLPAVQADHVRMGYVTAMKSDGAFTFGTTELGAANTTVAYTNGTLAYDAAADMTAAKVGNPAGTAISATT